MSKISRKKTRIKQMKESIKKHQKGISFSSALKSFKKVCKKNDYNGYIIFENAVLTFDNITGVMKKSEYEAEKSITDPKACFLHVHQYIDDAQLSDDILNKIGSN